MTLAPDLSRPLDEHFLAPSFLPEGERRDTRDLRFLRLVGNAAANMLAATDQEAMLQQLFLLLRAELPVDLYLHYGCDAMSGLQLESYSGITPEQAEKLARLTPGQYICGRVALEKQPIAISEAKSSDDPELAIAHELQINCYFCVPLLVRGEVIGTIGFGMRETPCFDTGEMKLIEIMGAYVALAKHRLASERQLREALERSERLAAERRKMEYEVLRLTRLAALESVAAKMAHELNQPLAAATNYLAAARLAPSGSREEDVRRIQLAEQQLLRAGAVVKQIRMMIAARSPRKETLAIGPVIEEATRLACAMDAAENCRIELSLDPDAMSIAADPVQIIQTLATLCRHALETCDPASFGLHIHVRRIGEHVAIDIADTGHAGAIEALGLPFNAADAPVAQDSRLDLAVAKAMLETNDGGLEWTCNSDGTPCFRVFVPAAEPSLL